MGPAAILSVLVNAKGVQAVNAQLATVQGSLVKTGAAATAMGAKMTAAGAKTVAAGRAMTRGFTLAMAAIGVAAFKAFNDVDEGLDNIQVATGKSGKALRRLQADFKAVAGTVNQDFATTGQVMGDLNSRTGATGKRLQALTRQVLELSRMTGEDAAGSVRSLTRVMGDWGVSVAKAPRLLDTLFVASQKTRIPIGQLADQLVKYGAPLRQMGFGLNQTAAILGKFEKEGVNAELVMGSMRIALGKMAREGVADPAEALGKLTDRIKNAGSAGKANALALEVFGARAGPDMAAAIREGRFEIGDLMKALSGTDGAVMKTAAQTLDASDKMARAWNKAKLALAPLGEAISTGLATILEKLGPLLGRFGDWLNGLSPQTRAFAIGLGLAVAAAGPLIVVLGSVVSSIGALTAAFGAAATFLAANPFVLVIAGLVALGAALVIAYKRSEEFRRVVDSTFAAIKSVVEPVIGWLRTALPAVWEFIVSAARRTLAGIKQAFGGIADVIKGVVDVVAGIIKGDWGRVWDGLKSIVTGAIDTVLGLLRAWSGPMREALVRVAEAAWEGLKKLPGLLLNVAEAALKAVWGVLRDGPSTGLRLAGDIREKIKEGLSKLPGALWNIARNAVNKLVDGIESLFGKVTGAAADLRGKIGEELRQLATKALQWGKDFVQGLIDGITSKIQDAVNAAQDLAEQVGDVIPKVWEIGSPSKMMRRMGVWLGEGLIQGLAAISGKAVGAAAKLAKNIGETFFGGVSSNEVLFPLEARIRELEALRERLEAKWARADQRRERRELAAAVKRARRGVGSAQAGLISARAGGGGSLGGTSGLEWAKSAVGHFAESTGSNTGPELDRLQREFGMRAQAWCAMFVAKALDKAGVKGNVMQPSAAGVWQFRQWAATGTNGFQRGIKHKPKVGDLMMFGNDHIALVEKVVGNTVHTIEGNTSAGKVARLTRSASSGDYARPIYTGAVAGTAPARAAASAGRVRGGGNMLTKGQKAFGQMLVQLTGMDRDVIAGWIFGEMNGAAAKAREKAKNHNWLNIGYTDSGPMSLTRDKLWRDPIKAAKATAEFMKGQRWGAGGSIPDIIKTAGMSDAAQRAAIARSGWASGGYHGGTSLSGITGAALGTGINASGLVRGGDGGSIADAVSSVREAKKGVREAIQALKDFNTEAGRARQLAKIDTKIEGLQNLVAFRDSVKGIREQLRGALSSAVDAFKERWEKTRGSLFDLQTADMIANSPAARELARLRGEEANEARAAEDAENQRALNEAIASGDAAAIAAAEARIRATERSRRMAELEIQAEWERTEIERTRAEERETRKNKEAETFERVEGEKLKSLTRNLNAQAITYAQFVAQVKPLLDSIGQSFTQDDAAEAAFAAVGLNPAAVSGLSIGAAVGRLRLPSYDGGGFIPGPKGAPYPILAHGGEQVLTPEQQRARGGIVVDQRHYGDVVYKSEVDMERERRKSAFALQTALRGR